MRRAQPLVAGEHARWARPGWRRVGEDAERTPDIQHALDVAWIGVLRPDRARRTRPAWPARRVAPRRRTACRPGRRPARRGSPSARRRWASIISRDWRSTSGLPVTLVAQERLEGFDHVAGVQVHGAVEVHDHVVQQVVGEALAPGAVGAAREGPVQVLAILGIDVDAPLVEAGAVEQGNDDDRAVDVLGLQEPPSRSAARVPVYSAAWMPAVSKKFRPPARGRRPAKYGHWYLPSSGSSNVKYPDSLWPAAGNAIGPIRLLMRIQPKCRAQQCGEPVW